MILERFAGLHDVSINQSLLDSRMGKGKIAGETVILAEPQTFMNLSGVSVRRLADYFKITAEEIIVLHDDLDLPFQTIRLKAGGGAWRPQGSAFADGTPGKRRFCAHPVRNRKTAQKIHGGGIRP
jgi:PTH1 family peptidyl-tRNA hydrolase